VGLPSDQVQLAYAKSLAALEYLRDGFGMGEVCRILKGIPSADFEVVLHDEIRMNYADFEEEVANYLVKKYGS
jgi:hypothetical protein